MQGFMPQITYRVSAGRADEGDGDGRTVASAEVGCRTAAESVLQHQPGEKTSWKRSYSSWLKMMLLLWLIISHLCPIRHPFLFACDPIFIACDVFPIYSVVTWLSWM